MLCSLTYQKSPFIAFFGFFYSMFECNSTYSKKRGFHVKYTPETNKQTNKQIIALRKKERKQIVRILNMVSFEPQFYVS